MPGEQQCTDSIVNRFWEIAVLSNVATNFRFHAWREAGSHSCVTIECADL